MSEMLDRINEFARQFPARRDPVPSRLEVGTVVHLWLRQQGPSANDVLPWEAPPLPVLFGVPVVPIVDMDPWEWRLLDMDGEQIKAGTIRLNPVGHDR